MAPCCEGSSGVRSTPKPLAMLAEPDKCQLSQLFLLESPEASLVCGVWFLGQRPEAQFHPRSRCGRRWLLLLLALTALGGASCGLSLTTATAVNSNSESRKKERVVIFPPMTRPTALHASHHLALLRGSKLYDAGHGDTVVPTTDKLSDFFITEKKSHSDLIF